MDLRRHCERYDCREFYAPIDSNQKYCSLRCGKICVQRRLRKKKRNAMSKAIYLLVKQYNKGEITARELSYQIHLLGKF